MITRYLGDVTRVWAWQVWYLMLLPHHCIWPQEVEPTPLLQSAETDSVKCPADHVNTNDLKGKSWIKTVWQFFKGQQQQFVLAPHTEHGTIMSASQTSVSVPQYGHPSLDIIPAWNPAFPARLLSFNILCINIQTTTEQSGWETRAGIIENWITMPALILYTAWYQGMMMILPLVTACKKGQKYIYNPRWYQWY